MRRLAIIVLAAAAGVGLLSSTSSAFATANTDPVAVTTAADDGATDLAAVDVVQVSGLIDEILIDEIQTAIRRSTADGSQALILQMNSGGAVASRERMADLVQSIIDSPVPIGIWVGPSGASLTGYGAQLLAVADATGMAPGTRIGKIGTPLVGGGVIDFGPKTLELGNESIGFQDARSLGVLKLQTTDEGVPSVKNMVLAMDGLQARGHTLDTVTDSRDDNGSLQKNATLVRFFKLSLINQLMHTVSSPAVAYLLFIVGLALLIFEFFTAGVGVAGVVGAGALILSCYGLFSLPVNGWAVAAILLAMFAFAVDVQVGIPRLWTGVGIVLLSFGSWFLYQDVRGADIRPSWITLIAGIGGAILAFVVGMPSMVRTRFATPTVGREWMVGEMGVALGDVNPEGVVEVSGGRWRARTNRSTPLKPGDNVRVVAIDGVTLEVEPEEGGARDYREMRKSRSSTEQTAASTN